MLFNYNLSNLSIYFRPGSHRPAIHTLRCSEPFEKHDGLYFHFGKHFLKVCMLFFQVGNQKKPNNYDTFNQKFNPNRFWEHCIINVFVFWILSFIWTKKEKTHECNHPNRIYDLYTQHVLIQTSAYLVNAHLRHVCVHVFLISRWIL